MQYSPGTIMIHHDMFAPSTPRQQALYLEHYLQSQEAAKCFDDDLDFCPSLTAAELVDILQESASAQKKPQMKWAQQGRMGSNASPMSSPRVAAIKSSFGRPTSKAIAIVDPNSKTPVLLPSSEQTVGDEMLPKSRQGSFSSDSSCESSESFDMNGVELTDWSFQQSYMSNVQQMQHWQQSQFYSDVMYSSAAPSQGLQQETANSSSRPYSPMMMAF